MLKLLWELCPIEWNVGLPRPKPQASCKSAHDVKKNLYTLFAKTENLICSNQREQGSKLALYRRGGYSVILINFEETKNTLSFTTLDLLLGSWSTCIYFIPIQLFYFNSKWKSLKLLISRQDVVRDLLFLYIFFMVLAI